MTSTSPVLAQSSSASGLRDGAEYARQVLEKQLHARELPGAQYVVVTADQVLLELHLGQASVAPPRAMQRDTLQMAYSITKAITALAVLQLVEAGKLELARPLSDYCTHPYGPSVTLESLLAHSARIPNPPPLDWFVLAGERLDRGARLRALLGRHPKLTSPSAPGKGYSNLGYWLLESAVEAGSGQDFADYVQRQILDPLGISSTQATFELPSANNAEGTARRWDGMTLLLRLLTPGRFWEAPSNGWSRAARLLPIGRGYGGLFTSAFALSRFLQDLLQDTPRLLSPTLRDTLLAERTHDGKPTSTTLGWVIGQLEGVPYVGKQGGGFGFHGNVRLYRSLGLATVLLCNRTEVSAGPIDRRSDAIDVGFLRERRR
jgi:D-alanyl-D-alanine carboxypeptidase